MNLLVYLLLFNLIVMFSNLRISIVSDKFSFAHAVKVVSVCLSTGDVTIINYELLSG